MTFIKYIMLALGNSLIGLTIFFLISTSSTLSAQGKDVIVSNGVVHLPNQYDAILDSIAQISRENLVLIFISGPLHSKCTVVKFIDSSMAERRDYIDAIPVNQVADSIRFKLGFYEALDSCNDKNIVVFTESRFNPARSFIYQVWEKGEKTATFFSNAEVVREDFNNSQLKEVKLLFEIIDALN